MFVTDGEKPGDPGRPHGSPTFFSLKTPGDQCETCLDTFLVAPLGLFRVPLWTSRRGPRTDPQTTQVEQTGFQHLLIDISVPRIAVFRPLELGSHRFTALIAGKGEASWSPPASGKKSQLAWLEVTLTLGKEIQDMQWVPGRCRSWFPIQIITFVVNLYVQ